MPRRRLILRKSPTLSRDALATFSPKTRSDGHSPRLTAYQRKIQRREPPKRMDDAAIVTVLEQLSPKLRARLKSPSEWQSGDDIILSAKTPVIDDRGHLFGWGIVSYGPTTPALYFDYSPTKKVAIGGLEIWLKNLDTSGIYFVEISLSVLGGGIRVGSSDAPHFVSPAQGIDHRVLVTIVDPTYDITLISLRPESVQSWGFFEARIRRLD